MEINEIPDAAPLTADSFLVVAVPDGAGGYTTGKVTLTQLFSALRNLDFSPDGSGFTDERMATTTKGGGFGDTIGRGVVVNQAATAEPFILLVAEGSYDPASIPIS